MSSQNGKPIHPQIVVPAGLAGPDGKVRNYDVNADAADLLDLQPRTAPPPKVKPETGRRSPRIQTPATTSREIHLKALPAKAGKFCIVSTNGTGELHRDTFDLNNARGRLSFVRGTLKKAFPEHAEKDWPAEAKAAIESELTKLAQIPLGTPIPLPEVIEVDVSNVVRPELFHTAAVSGLTLAVMTSGGESKLTPRWRTYLRWAGGGRQVLDRPDAIPLSDGRRVYIHPDPGEPAANESPAWSAVSRGRWLEGKAKVTPAGVFKQLLEQIAFYLEFETEAAAGTTATIALWIVLTFAYPAWDAVPYLYVGGPMGSGKSRLLDVLSRLAFRSLTSANLTAAALFRTLHARGGTMLFDEAERLGQDRPDMQDVNAVFLSGYRRGATATRLEPVGDTFRPVQFEVYGPKALACIKGLPATLASRCIPIMMFRAAGNSEKTRRRLDGDPEKWAKLRDALHILALDNGPTWSAIAHDQSPVPASVNGRNFELWQPLLALAKWFEDNGVGGLLSLVQSHATRSVTEAADDAVPEADETLLEILAEMVRGDGKPTASDLLAAAKEKMPSTFDKWQPNTVTKRLKLYGIPTPKKSNGLRQYRVTNAMLRLIQERYGLDLSSEGHPEGPTLTDPDRP